MASLAAARSSLAAWASGVPGWFGGLLAGVQAALLSLALVIVPAFAMAAVTPTTGSDGAVPWGAATRAAARLWLLAFAVPWETEGATITLAPLGLTAITAFMISALSRRFVAKTWTSWLLAVASFSAAVFVIATLAWGDGDQTKSHAVTAAMIALALAAPSAAIGTWRAHGATLDRVSRWPRWWRTGIRLGLALVAVHALLASLAGVAWALQGRYQVGHIASALGVDLVSGTSLAALETAYVPNLVAWYMGWTSGVGFDVGLAHFAPAELVAAPLPMIPLLGALPASSGGGLIWVPLVLVVAAATVRLAMRSVPRSAARWGMDGVGLAVYAGTLAVLCVVSSGSMGPGTLSSVRVETGPVVFVSLALMAPGVGTAELALGAASLMGFRAHATPPSQGRLTP